LQGGGPRTLHATVAGHPAGMARILASENDLLKQATGGVLQRSIGRFRRLTARDPCFSG